MAHEVGSTEAIAAAENEGLRIYEDRPVIVLPTVGRTVHYHSYGTPGGEYKPLPRAAIVTEIDVPEAEGAERGTVGLCVLNPTGMFFNQHVPFSHEPKPGHWNWPPRT